MTADIFFQNVAKKILTDNKDNIYVSVRAFTKEDTYITEVINVPPKYMASVILPKLIQHQFHEIDGKLHPLDPAPCIRRIFSDGIIIADGTTLHFQRKAVCQDEVSCRFIQMIFDSYGGKLPPYKPKRKEETLYAI